MCRLTLFAVVFSMAAIHAESKPPNGFTALFNGKDLSGWHGRPDFKLDDFAKLPAEEKAKKILAWTEEARKHWTVSGDELVYDGQGPFLTTDAEFGDSELLIEFKTTAKADGGFVLRGMASVKIEAETPSGEWNRYRILHIGERVTVYLNDKLVVDHARLENSGNRDLPLPRNGVLQLPTHGGESRWRNLFLRAIPPAEATEILRSKNATGFVDAFNGKDLAGWSGAKENYDVVDGAIVCKPKKGGNIFTDDRYADFVARLEYKLPPAGNNGLAIRYPGKGQASLDAMCEIQILDDDSPKYKTIDKRQFNGSAYGMIAAHRGFLHPVGEWNFMEVTVKGSTIRVELNGTRILDGDMAKVTETHQNRKHPGKDLTEGHFGFCGHNDPVAFRNIRIKKLDRP
jgi:Domain of Unknown Function (DUF1080)